MSQALPRIRAGWDNPPVTISDQSMSNPLSSANADPRPIPPERPLPSDCCDSGCPVCVHDLYAEELEAYAKALAAWKLRHPDMDTAPP